jgi:hypothetical protein
MNEPTYEQLQQTLDDLYQGRKIIVPHDIDHAHNMLKLAGAYIHDDKQRMWSYLKEPVK